MLKNGEREQPLHAVTPASMSLIPSLERDFDPPPQDAKTTHRRLQLAEWITDKDNPLTARVFVNRLWQHHFGAGIVRSPNNFGFLADPPTHPQLLDWLAAEFIRGSWKIKRMHKLILMSRTWRQSSLHPQFAKYHKLDSGNRLWWRAERRRLDAEALRDSMLAVTSELDKRIGGPGFRPTISAAALEGLSRKSAAWQASSPQEQTRRSLYLFAKRGLLSPMMTTFNFADTTQSCAKRDVTTVPTQALVLMNNPFVHDRSEALAQVIQAKFDQPIDQAKKLWGEVYGRCPTPTELHMATTHLTAQAKRFEAIQRQPSSKENEMAKRHLKKSLVLHLRADQGITLDSSGHLSHWQDLSGHDHHASQPEAKRQPAHDTSGINNNAVVNFDGKGQFLHLQGKLLPEQEYTIIAVATDRGNSGHRTLFSNWNGKAGNSGTSLFLGLTGEATVRFSDAYADAGRVAYRNKPFVITAVNGADGSSVFQNGRKLSARETPLPERNLSTDWVIGQQGNINGEYWTGGIAEICVFSRALTDQERLSVEGELHTRYGIPVVELEESSPPTPAVLAIASLAHVLLNSNEFLYVD
jgi:hypothetical protein